MNSSINNRGNVDSLTMGAPNDNGQNYPTSCSNRISPLSFNELPCKNPADWVTFNSAQWPGPTYEESPLSSDGSGDVYSPLPDDNSWDPFEQSFSNSRMAESFEGSAEPFNDYQSTAYNGRSPDPTMAPAFPYVNLSAITEDHAMIDDEMNEVPRGDQITTSSELPSPLVRQPAWGNRRGSSSSITKSAKSKHHKRTKSSSSENSYTTSANSPISSAHKLRSTSTVGSRPSSSYSTTTPGARTNHNLVEKQYRTRLNGQFETLLQSLPREAVGDAGGEKRVSKAEVLVLAKEHIRELEREKKILEEENFGLENAVEQLRRRWIELGGVVMP